MERVTLYLRTALFTFAGDAGHVPMGATVIEGAITDKEGGTLLVKTRRFLDDRGRLLGEREVSLLVPWSKIDHVLIND